MREALDDLARLAQLANGGDEPQGEEADYAELVEFVRIAVMSVYEDQAARSGDGQRGPDEYGGPDRTG